MTVRVGVSVDRPIEHRAEFVYDFEGTAGGRAELVFPAWVPGSYTIRPIGRAIRTVSASSPTTGASLPVERLEKGRWSVSVGTEAAVRVRYTVYGHDTITEALDVTPDHLFLNAALCIPYLDGRKEEPFEIALHLPPDWRVYTELAEVERQPPTYRAANYDELVDEPIDCGTPVVLTTTAAGIPHRLVLCGSGGNYEPHRLENDLGRIAEATSRLFGGLPFRRYTYFFHLTDHRGGGLEHRNSTSIVVPRTVFRPESDYQGFLHLCAHEYFHLYNVKRIRPKVLGPFDYTRENYTRMLWAMEGTTDYYGPLLVRRAGLITPAKYLDGLAQRIKRYREIPGRLVTSLETASLSTWVDQYAQYEESVNQSVSYYLKGGLVSNCLDLEIRQGTENRSSLDDVYRRLWSDYGAKEVGLSEGEIREVADRVTGLSLAGFFGKYVAGTEEIDFAPFLRSAGLEIAPKEKPVEPGDDAEPGWLGVDLEESKGLARVRAVRDGSPGRRSGLSPGDEIVALDGSRVGYPDFSAAMKRYPAGSSIDVALFRRGWLIHLPVVTGTTPPEKLRISAVSEPSELQKTIYEGWIGAPWEPKKSATPS